MCGRLALFSDPAILARHFGLAVESAYVPRWNVAPRQSLCIVRHDAACDAPVAGEVEWGLLPGWADPAKPGPRPINARAESAAQRPMFRDAWRRRRCLVPADGWYEWTSGDDGRDPWFFALPNGALLGLAGLWAMWRGPGGAVIESATILTREAHPELAAIHARMPAIIDPADYAAWLDPERPADPLTLEAAIGQRIRARRVSRRVNSVAHEGPELLDAVPGFGA